MNKEINDLLTLSDHHKDLQLNGLFCLRAQYADDQGVSVEYSGKAPVSVHITLVYTAKHNKNLFRSVPIESRTYQGIMEEVPAKMQTMLSEIGAELAKAFSAGYLC